MLLLLAATAGATTCVSVDEFNDWAAAHGPVDAVTVSFDVTGVNPNDFYNTKGALVDLGTQTCASGASMALKVYGATDEANDAHPPGTLKQEYGYTCCESGDCGEAWADPNASAVVFTDGSETCDVTVWTDPDTFGYRLVCSSGTFEGLGTNDYDMPVDTITLLSLLDGYTWRMDNASSTWNEVCFDPGDIDTDPGDPGDTGTDTTFDAVQDVTVSASSGGVYPDDQDLAVEAGDSEVYVSFDLSSVQGTVTSATLLLDAHTYDSAHGTGADVYLASGTDWSEDTLTWATRPGWSGTRLDGVAPIEPAGAYELDVSAAVTTGGVYAFALVPPDGDSDGAHLISKEAGEGPRLRITWEPDGGDGTGDGTGTGDSAGNGTGDSAGNGAGDSGADHPDLIGQPSSVGGCGCASGGSGVGWAALGVLATLRRRRLTSP